MEEEQKDIGVTASQDKKGENAMRFKTNSVINPRPNDSVLLEFDKSWELKLPMDYKSFIKKHNGAIPKNGVFMHKGHEYLIERFLGIVEDYEDDDLGVYDIEVIESQIGERLTANEDLIGMEVVPIAALFGGDFVCLDVRETHDNPSVCIWYHEESGVFDPVTDKVADSFTEFLAMLPE